MKQSIFRSLADLRFAILILLLIGTCSILGTIIEQDQSLEVYKINYPILNPLFGFLSWDVILKLGLNHVYTTWWFLSLISIFAFSLLLCTFLQQLPSLKIARRCQFFRTPTPFYKLSISTVVHSKSFDKCNEILSVVKQAQYSIFQQKNVIYCYKGLIGRIAPITVHFSMILILLGTLTGALSGFKAQEIIPNTESFHIQNILTVGPLAKIPLNTLRINSFWITYTKQKTISQFYSDLSVLNQEGFEIRRKTISVNDPLIYKNTYYYQTDWSLVGLRFWEKPLNELEYPLTAIPRGQEKVWLTWISKNRSTNQGIFLILDNLEGYCSAYNEKGEFLGSIELNEGVKFLGSTHWVQIISSTGLQIKTDPGLKIIYFGFLLLMASTLVSYVTYSQIWIVQAKHKIFIGGTTNRAVFAFNLEFFELVRYSNSVI